jgi:RNA polymerase sigma factor
VIRQNLVDYFRAQGRHSREVQAGWIEEEAIIEYNDINLKLEIEAITQILEKYGFSFLDLVACSPKANKTKAACAEVVTYILSSPVLIEEMRVSKQLPAKLIVKNVGLPRKILDRHRKYIVAAVEILHGDYPYLSDYLSFIREADKK